MNELLTTVGKISEPWADNVMRGDTLVRRSFLDAAAMSDNWFEQVRVQCSQDAQFRPAVRCGSAVTAAMLPVPVPTPCLQAKSTTDVSSGHTFDKASWSIMHGADYVKQRTVTDLAPASAWTAAGTGDIRYRALTVCHVMRLATSFRSSFQALTLIVSGRTVVFSTVKQLNSAGVRYLGLV